MAACSTRTMRIADSVGQRTSRHIRRAMALAVLLRSARYCGNLADRMAWSPGSGICRHPVAVIRLSGVSPDALVGGLMRG